MTLYQYCEKYIEFYEKQQEDRHYFDWNKWLNFINLTSEENDLYEIEIFRNIYDKNAFYTNEGYYGYCKKYINKINYIKSKL